MTNIEEIWKDIPELIGKYQSSSIGRIRSIERTIVQSNGRVRKFPSKILKHFIDDSGYPRICLYKNDCSPRKYKVHRLVAMAFIPNPDNLPMVNHIDSNKLNACVENLEWCTAQENVIHSFEVGGRIAPTGFESPLGNPVVAIKISTGERSVHGSQKDAAKNLGLFQTGVNGCMTGRMKTTKGYRFEVYHAP